MGVPVGQSHKSHFLTRKSKSDSDIGQVGLGVHQGNFGGHGRSFLDQVGPPEEGRRNCKSDLHFLSDSWLENGPSGIRESGHMLGSPNPQDFVDHRQVAEI